MGRRSPRRETSQENILTFKYILTQIFISGLECIWTKSFILASRQRFLIVLTCSWVFWPKNNTERIWNYLKKLVLDPKHAKLDQKSPFRISADRVSPWRFPPLLQSTDCSLRQGAGGTEFARFGSRTCFLRWFYKRSQAYFGQKPEEYCFSNEKTLSGG